MGEYPFLGVMYVPWCMFRRIEITSFIDHHLKNKLPSILDIIIQYNMLARIRGLQHVLDSSR